MNTASYILAWTTAGVLFALLASAIVKDWADARLAELLHLGDCNKVRVEIDGKTLLIERNTPHWRDQDKHIVGVWKEVGVLPNVYIPANYATKLTLAIGWRGLIEDGKMKVLR